MNEYYTLQTKDGKLNFEPTSITIPSWLTEHRFIPERAEQGVSLASRMGDPDQIHCIVYRKEHVAGGNFALFFASSFLFAALARDNLSFALGMGFFGELTANARYGADVFENMELPDD